MSDVLTLPTTPRLPASILALVPLAALGAVAAVGTTAADLPTLTSLPLIAVVTAAFTAPALLAASHTLHVELPVDRVTGAFGAGLARAGRVAAGLLPLMVFEVLTSNLATALWLAGAGLAGAAGISAARRGLVGSDEPSRSLTLLTRGWAALAGLVGLRLLAVVLLGGVA